MTLDKALDFVKWRWWGILIAYLATVFVVYLLIWNIIEPIGVPEKFTETKFSNWSQYRIFWHCIASAFISTLIILVFQSMLNLKAIRDQDKAVLEAGNIKGGIIIGPLESFDLLAAEYWTPNKKLDVTNQLKERISNSKLKVTASNDIAGDPEIYVWKYLTVFYKKDGMFFVKTVKEGEELSIP